MGKEFHGKIGAVYVAMKANVPILPVRIIKEKPNRKLFTKVYVIYGNPITLDSKKTKDKETTVPEPTTKICPYCLSEIAFKATKCPHCTSDLNEK